MKRRRIFIFGIAAAATAVAGYSFYSGRQERSDRLREGIATAAALEAAHDYSAASAAYEQILSDPLADADRASLRYRLAAVQIQSNDLNRALGTLRALVEDDVARFQIDLGPLYLDLGRRFEESGRADLARIAYREGGGVAPARYEDFSRRLESLTERTKQQDGR